MKVMFKGQQVQIVSSTNSTTKIKFVDDGYLSVSGEFVYRELVLSNKHHKGSLFLDGICIL